jgi:hypothetical protein
MTYDEAGKRDSVVIFAPVNWALAITRRSAERQIRAADQDTHFSDGFSRRANPPAAAVRRRPPLQRGRMAGGGW